MNDGTAIQVELGVGRAAVGCVGVTGDVNRATAAGGKGARDNVGGSRSAAGDVHRSCTSQG